MLLVSQQLAIATVSSAFFDSIFPQQLVDSLVNLEIDHEIPQELYNSVAEVFIWLMKNEKRYKDGY